MPGSHQRCSLPEAVRRSGPISKPGKRSTAISRMNTVQTRLFLGPSSIVVRSRSQDLPMSCSARAFWPSPLTLAS